MQSRYQHFICVQIVDRRLSAAEKDVSHSNLQVYTCTCKKGFTGNGKTCTGKISFFLAGSLHNYSDLPFFQQHKNKMCLIIYKLSSSNDGSAPSCLVPIVDSLFSSSSFRSCKSFVRESSLLFKPSAQKNYACYLKRTLSRYIMNFSCIFSTLPVIK